MDICIVVPTAESVGQAGTRIRYQRLGDALRARGHRLIVEVIDTLRATSQLTHDVYLFSKCLDARARIVCHLLQSSDKLVGVDLFDDQYSQTADSRLLPWREGLRALAGQLHFFVCSTPRMREVASGFLQGLPGHVLADPAPAADSGALARSLQRRMERAWQARRVDVAWFGIGDNPHFPVGLHDLLAWAPALAPLMRDGWQARLRALTNRRALDAGGLERLSRLPLPWTVDEWSVEAEAELLADSLVAFLPVNAQAFSVAKSMNRAITALSAGAQVLSAGYPLYAPLGDLIYRDADTLLADLQQRRLRLGETTLPAMTARLAELASPVREAEALAGFLQGLAQERRRAANRGKSKTLLGVLHGVRSDKAVHQLAQRAGQLSIGSPFASPGLNYDVGFVAVDGGLQMQFSDAAMALLKRPWQLSVRPGASPNGREVKVLDVAAALPEAAARLREASANPSQAGRLVAYATTMRDVQALCVAVMERVVFCLSEQEPPFASHGASR